MAERKVNVFKVLQLLDRGDFSGYGAQFAEDERKEVDGLLSYPALRWMSAADDDAQHADALTMVNEFANSGYFELGRHRELQFKLLAVAGMRRFVKRRWLPGPGSARTGKIDQMLRLASPSMKPDEIELWLDMNGRDGVVEMARSLGYDKDQIKAVDEECKKRWKNGSGT